MYKFVCFFKIYFSDFIFTAWIYLELLIQPLYISKEKYFLLNFTNRDVPALVVNLNLYLDENELI